MGSRLFDCKCVYLLVEFDKKVFIIKIQKRLSRKLKFRKVVFYL